MSLFGLGCALFCMINLHLNFKAQQYFLNNKPPLGIGVGLWDGDGACQTLLIMYVILCELID